jgi:phenylalanine-4-hydroxylase
LSKIYKALRKNHNNDWLLPLELLELSNNTDLISEIKSHLNAIAKNKPELSQLIDSGLKLVETPIDF